MKNMKNKLIIFTVILAIATVFMTACVKDELDIMDNFRDGVKGMANATEFSREIRIEKDGFLQYNSEETFVKTDRGYDVTGTEKRLNDSSAATMWNETAINETKDGTADVAPTIDLKTDYFEEGFRLNETELRATVKDENVKDLLNLGDNVIKAPITDLVLELTLAENRLENMTISYSSGNSTVNIIYSFSY